MWPNPQYPANLAHLLKKSLMETIFYAFLSGKHQISVMILLKGNVDPF